MYGFENISANHGWSMAVLGAVIVFCGLAALSLVISQIYKILNFFELKKIRNAQVAAERSAPAAKPAPPVPRLPSVRELASVYRPLTEKLEAPFQLAQLYQRAAELDLPHVHLSITRLREAGVLISRGDGAFDWDQARADSL